MFHIHVSQCMYVIERFLLCICADDIALLAENEEHVQNMLNVMHECCHKWGLNVILTKSHVMHFKQAKYRILRSNMVILM